MRASYYDLRDNTINIESLASIFEDIGKLHIFGLQITVNKFALKMERTRRVVIKEHVDVSFSTKIYNEDLHLVTCNFITRFYSKHHLCQVKAEVSAKARYFYEPYTTRLQDYLYTYITGMIESDDRIMKLKYFKFPDSLRNYQHEFPEVYLARDEMYHWIDTDDFSSVNKIHPENKSNTYKWGTDIPIAATEISKELTDFNSLNEAFKMHMEDIRRKDSETRYMPLEIMKDITN